MQRRGLGRFLGKGYKNLAYKDPYIHSLSSKGIKSIPLNRYMGTWYRQGSIPTWFEKGCTNVRADYGLKDGKVLVRNSCDRDGKREVIYGEASPVSSDNRNLKVGFRPFTFFKGDYKIEYVDKDFKFAIVGHPKKKYLWILSRDKKIPKKKYDELMSIAKDKGYNVSEVRLGAKSELNLQILSKQISKDSDFEYDSIEKIEIPQVKKRRYDISFYGKNLDYLDEGSYDEGVSDFKTQIVDKLKKNNVPISDWGYAEKGTYYIYLQDETLDAKSRIATHLIPEDEYNRLFAKDYKPYEISYATTRIDNTGNVNIYVKDSGDAKRNKDLLRHEQEELKIFKRLISKGTPSNIADEMAHNMNPVKLEGVDEYYPLNPDT